MEDRPTPKPVIWMGSSRKDFGEFPAAVKDRMGYALFVAQQGAKHRAAKVERLLRFLSALGQDVEIVVKSHSAKVPASLHVG